MSDRTADPSTRAGISPSMPDDATALRGRLESFFRARQAETRGRWPENFQHPRSKTPLLARNLLPTQSAPQGN